MSKNMGESDFLVALSKLNPEQKSAVEAIEGPVMVLAGPGTGKTQVLTLRIANIIFKTDTAPESILALTFTDAGAKAMRERLQRYLGTSAHKLSIHTFHDFAGQLIRQYPDAYEQVIGGRPATEIEKIAIVETIINSHTKSSLRPSGNPVFYVKPILSAISLMKREYITPDKFLEQIEDQERRLTDLPKWHEKGAHKGKVRGEYKKLEKDIEKNRELLFIYRTYEKMLSTENLYDFDDMIFETVEALEKNEDMLLDLQERYQYILADEQQDVNGSQNRILELLASYHPNPNLFVVGDEKQSIYRFQGASLENFLFFEKKYTGAKTIALTNNYRSGQKILDLSHSLITQVDNPASDLRVPLKSHLSNTDKILRRAYSHEAIEDEDIITQICSLIKDGVKPREITIILRSNYEVSAFASGLRSVGIQAEASFDGDILYHPITNSVRALLKAVLEPNNNESLFLILSASYWGIPVADMVEILSNQSYARPLARVLYDEDFLRSLNLKEVDKVISVGQTLKRAREKMVTEAPQQVLQSLLQDSGFIVHIMNETSQEGARVLRRLYDEIESLVRTHQETSLQEVSQMFDSLKEHSVPLSVPFIHTNRQSVQVMTAHKSKGLEFEHVFIPHLTESRWGDQSRPQYFKIELSKLLDDDDFDKLDDERKLLYVAMTRAKLGLYLSYSKENNEGRPQLETPLLEAVDTSLIEEISTTEVEENFKPLTKLSRSSVVPIFAVELLLETLQERGLSATALNNYLRSPWTYLYRNVLRLPEVQSESAQFGTIVHGVLRRALNYKRQEGHLPDLSDIKLYLEQDLAKLPLTTIEYTRLHEHGLDVISYYLDQVSASLPVISKEEYSLEASLKTGNPILPEVHLRGNLDRLDFDTEGNLLRVVDYKTGKPKTRGFIEGTTKDSNGDYKRQLTFYALLLSLQDDERLHCREGVLSFVEADEKGVIHDETFLITEAEIVNLKTDIVRVVNEIVTGAFLTEACDKKVCDYCHLAEGLQERLLDV